MGTNPPSVYLLHGEDDFSISQYVKELVGKLGDSTFALLNINRLDGGKSTLDDLRTAVSVVPLMTPRRLVIVNQPLSKVTSLRDQEEYIKLLNQVPVTTALVLIENKILKDDHWLIVWASKEGERTIVREFRLPKGGEMVKWIQNNVKQKGGKISQRAAFLLSGFVGNDLWLANHEVNKLIDYTNKEGEISEEIVSDVALSIPQGDIFALVDAIGMMNKRQALSTLRTLLDSQDPVYVFAMIVRQLRLVLQAKDIIAGGGDRRRVAKVMQVHPYVAEKVSAQGDNFSFKTLEGAYNRLLRIDLAVKTGRQELEVALERFVAGFG